jgi:hypothetical protein
MAVVIVVKMAVKLSTVVFWFVKSYGLVGDTRVSEACIASIFKVEMTVEDGSESFLRNIGNHQQYYKS